MRNCRYIHPTNIRNEYEFGGNQQRPNTNNFNRQQQNAANNRAPNRHRNQHNNNNSQWEGENWNYNDHRNQQENCDKWTFAFDE